MRIVAQFDPSSAASGSFNAGLNNGSGRIVVYNESIYNLSLSWGSFSTYCPAWTAMLYCIQNNSPNVAWSIQSQLVANGAPISQVMVESLDNSEAIFGTYPMALMRSTNIGNSVSLGNSATSIQNDGNVVGTVIIEATPIGDATSAVDLTNDGHLTLGNATHPGSISTDDGLIFSDGGGVLSVARWLYANLVIALPGNDMALNVATAHKIALQVNNADVVDIDVNGLQLISGKLNLLSGALSHISSFGPYGVGTTPTFFNHNLGVIPDLIILQPTGAISTVRTCVYDDLSLTATQVKLTANTTFNVRGVALKF